ncbi:MAG: phage tail protein [Endomicrobium sp.]|jgi:microcystin-dependent protein|nr:phage tail protein [Endomicrobium sp.]
MKKCFFGLLSIFVFIVLLNAEVPNEIRYTGRLKSYQTPVSDTVSMTFKLYYNETGGNSVWSSNSVNVSVSSGIFTYVLKPTGIDWSKGDVWLELTVGSTILAPREKFMAQVYSFHSITAEHSFTADHSITSEKLSSNNEISIQVGTTTAYIGISNNKIYFRPSSSSDIGYLGVPPGTVIAYAGNTIPEGYLLCDGSILSRSDYPELFKAIGTIYGGSGSTFNLPNFKGMFLRGNGSNTVTTTLGGKITIASANLAVQQSDAIRNITGTFEVTAVNAQGLIATTSGAIYGSTPRSFTVPIGGREDIQRSNMATFDASRVVPTANENRPANYSVNYCIKY